MTRTNRIIVAVWLLLALFVLMVADWLFASLRLPVVCLAVLGFLLRSRARRRAFATSIPTSMLCLGFGFLFALGQLIAP